MTMRKKSKKAQTIPIKNRLISALGVSDCIISGGYIELRGRGEMSVGGCKRIVKYTEEEIVLRLSDCLLMVRGKCLSCTAFYSGSIGINGYVESVCFSGSNDYNTLKQRSEECSSEA